ncbi:MAG TPA: 4-(cytidine 5'-diphospho)-2-C-methyl-D-erythritol kinase [Paracoccaceae bacterium]|nr:4-(cytidine 5'-diphospho)-2-C-methyl-D-erythritol kinase [Paracoccaceae bacterium]
MAAEPLTLLARAKVNLFLHVTGRRGDGFHLLDSLVVFPAVGDLLSVRPAEGLGLTLAGPFAGGLEGEPNLVLRAAAALCGKLPGRGAAFHLEKRLPVAAGLGGGSADAAAAVRLLEALWGVALPEAERDALALALGADVPVCLGGRPARMRGIGEEIEPVTLPRFWTVLVNPGLPVSTREAFRRIGATGRPAGPLPAFRDAADMAAWLRGQRNDLEAPARALCPPVAEVLAVLAEQDGVLLARMSGSGATCFAISGDAHAARAVTAAVRALRSDWWVEAAPVGE